MVVLKIEKKGKGALVVSLAMPGLAATPDPMDGQVHVIPAAGNMAQLTSARTVGPCGRGVHAQEGPVAKAVLTRSAEPSSRSRARPE